MTRTLDQGKHFGTVLNHPEVSFIQDGIHFDATGEEITYEKTPSDPPPSDPPPEQLTDATKTIISDFLKEFLSGGSIAPGNIKKATEPKGYQWADVESVAADMGILKYKQGVVSYWKLKPD